MYRVLLLGALVGLSVVALPPARADQDADHLQALVQKVAPCIANVKIVVKMEMKMEGESENNESRMTAQGVVVDPDGLLALSSISFSPGRLMEMFGSMGESAGFKMTPTSFKVTFGGDVKEYDAFLAATDAKSGLAFVKIEGLGDKKLPAIDFGTSAVPALGQRVIAVSRLTKGYDFAPFFQTGRVSGEISKPQKAWMVDGSVGAIGLPVFSEAGEALGVLSIVASGVKDDVGSDAGMGMSFMMRMFGGGGGSPIGSFILPAAMVKGLIDQAKVQAVTVAAERAKRAQAAPTKPATPPTTAPSKPSNPAPKPGTPKKP